MFSGGMSGAEEGMKYKVELIPSEEGFAVSCPELPGCWSQGVTEDEALENIKSAIVDYLAAVDEVNRRKQTRYVEVVAS
jgi:predicted RNase H-like HicB family nuclease